MCKLPPPQKNIAPQDTVNKRSPLQETLYPLDTVYEFLQRNCIPLHTSHKCLHESQNMPLQDPVYKLPPLQKNKCRLDMLNT